MHNRPARGVQYLVQGLKLNPGEYTVQIFPVGSEQGHEEHIKIETDRVALIHSAK